MTKISLILAIIFTLAILSCNNTPQVEGIWISGLRIDHNKYSLSDGMLKAPSNKIEGLFMDSLFEKKILLIRKDSFRMVNFNESFYQAYDEREFKYSLKQDSIVLNINDDRGAIKYQLTKNKDLLLEKAEKQNSLYEQYYRKLEIFGNASKEKEISSFLINNPIQINKDSIEIQFHVPHWEHMGKFTQSDTTITYGTKDNWCLYSAEEELFLDFGRQFIHIKSFDGQSILGNTYDHNISEIRISKSESF